MALSRASIHRYSLPTWQNLGGSMQRTNYIHLEAVSMAVHSSQFICFGDGQPKKQAFKRIGALRAAPHSFSHDCGL